MPEDLRAARTLELRLLGAASFWLDGQPLPQPFAKISALLAYLALEGPQPRVKLAQLLWSDLDSESARRNLRLVLHRLKAKSPRLYERLELNQQTLGLGLPFICDLDRPGELLEGLKLSGASAFEGWLEARRNQLAEDRRRARLEQIEQLENGGELQGALELHLEILAQDNLQEHHQHQAMGLLYRLGQREAALERFAQFRAALQHELGLEPLPETLALAQQIQSAVRTIVATKTAPSLASNSPQVPLVGRTEAWEWLEQAWASGQTLIIRGEAGVGKSRLMLEFATSKGPYHAGAGWPTDSAVPFATGSRLVRSLLASKPQLNLPNWVRAELARILPELGQAAPDSSDGRLRLYEAFAELVLRVLDEGTALLWDDLHFFDSFSLEAGLYLTQRLSPRRMLLAHRRCELRSEHQTLLDQMVQASQAMVLDLGPLEPGGLGQLVQAVSGMKDTLFVGRLHQVTGGNPFFALETLKILAENSKILAEEPTKQHEWPLPNSVRETVMGRVKRLGPEVRRLLEAASLAQGGFALETLAGATALSEWESLLALERSLQAGLIEHSSTVYRFTHDLIRQSLQDNLSAERKKLLHRKLAQSLEQLGGPAAQIAEHLEHAGQASQAVSWRIKAAEGATRIYAHLEALQQYRQALQDGADDPVAFAIHQARIQSLEALHDLEGRLVEIEAMAALARRMGDQKLEADVALQASRYNSALGRYTEAIVWAERALTLPTLQESLRLSALHRLGIDLLLMNRLDQSRQHLEQALRIAEQTAPQRLSQLNDTLCNNALFAGDIPAAAEYSRQSLASLLPTDTFSGAVAHSTAARVARALGDYPAALDHTKQAIAGAKAQSHLRLLDRFLTNHLTLCIEMGQAEAAKTPLEEWLSLFPPPRDPTVEGRFQERYSDYLLVCGDLGEAIEAAQRGIELADQVQQINQQLYRRPNLARLFNQLGDPAGARSVLELLDHSRPTQPAYIELRYFAELAHCLLQEGKVKVALKALQTLPQNWQKVEQGALLLLYQARCHLALNQPAAALEALRDLPPAILQIRLPALGLSLEASHRLGLPVGLLQEKVRNQLEAAPPLETLELGRALLITLDPQSSEAQELRQRCKQKLRQLEASLKNYPQLRRQFFARQLLWLD